MFVTFSEASFGYQVGVKESHMLILLMTDTAVDNFTKGKMELGGTGGFALGTYGLGVSGTGSSLAALHRLPTIFGLTTFVEAGGLMACGPNRPELWRRAATFVYKILNGAKLGELPVEQPVRFDLVINVRTAQELQLTIPPSLLLRADEIIQ